MPILVIVLRTPICLLAALSALGLGAAPSASAFAVNDDLTGLPQINQAITDARAYWQGRQAPCPTGIRVTVADLAGAGEAADANAVGGCSIALDMAWVNGQPTRTQYCALFSHEYGHLLGYGHEDRAEDIDKVMSLRGTPTYCRTFGVRPPTLPRPCSWPAWARSTPPIRRLYADGRKYAAHVAYRSWRKHHPHARLPGPCKVT